MSPLFSFSLLCIVAVACGGPSARFPPDADLRPWKTDSRISVQDFSTTRLTTDVIPSYYKINLRPILEDGPGQFTTPGDVLIKVQASRSTNSITFNSRDITIDTDSIRVTNSDSGLVVPVESTSSDNTEFTFTLNLAESLTASQNYNISISFTSLLPSNPLAGLYRSSYTVPGTNETRYLAATQFERSSARRAFPCFDEPEFRAVFEISLGRTEQYHTLCNMEIVETTPDPNLEGWVWDHYEPTVNMPTYLIAIVVSDFLSEAAPPELFRGKISKAWAQPFKMTPGAGIYGAETTAKVITYFEDLFLTTYDLPKMDSAAIPDFSPGAMENWGLVTYRENLLLYYNGTTTESARRSISSVISHELAHQWFGNIVTMKWWNDIWLNEGFASYVSYWGLNWTDPEYDGFHWIITDSYHSAMAYDITANSQPVSNDGSNPSAIIYDKGAAIIRMMEGFLTWQTLFAGLTKYLQRHAYGTAEQDELFLALNEQAIEDGTLDPNLNVKLIMDTWTLQTGFPLIRVNSTGPNQITVTQESYTNTPRKVNTTALDPNELWYVPISYHNAADPGNSGAAQRPKFWIPKDVAAVVHDGVNTSEWMYINTCGTGYFRVLYDDNLRILLQQKFVSDPTTFSPASKSQTLDDHFKFAFPNAGDSALVTPAEAMGFTTYLDQEYRLTPWLAVFNNLGDAFDLFSGNSQYYSLFKDYFGSKVNSSLHLLGVRQTPEPKQGDKVILRNNLLQWGCQFGLPACYEYANDLRLQWVDNPLDNPVPVDLQATMYCAIVAAGGDAGYNFVLGMFFRDVTSWRNALGCATEDDVIDQILELSLNSQSGISKEDASTLLQRVAMSPEGRPRLLAFLQTHTSDIISYHNAEAISSAISTLSNYLSHQEDHDNISAYISANSEALQGQMPSLNRSLAAIQGNIQWMNNYGLSMVEFFEAQKSGLP